MVLKSWIECVVYEVMDRVCGIEVMDRVCGI